MSRFSHLGRLQFTALAQPALASAVAAVLSGCASVAPTTPAAPAAVVAGTPAAAAPAAAVTSAAARPAGAASGAAVAGAAVTAAARPAAPGGLPAFAEVTRDATSKPGFLNVWTRDDKTWLEIPAALLDKPLFLGSSIATGMGDSRFWPGLMGRDYLVVLRRVGNSVQLLALNDYARAPAGTPLALAVADSYSGSLLGAAPLAAAPNAQSKSLLVDAAALMGGDITGTQTQLEASFRLAYALDRANASIERVRTQASGLALTMRQHFAVPRLPVPPVPPAGAPAPNPAALPSPPQSVPDARSLFISTTYTLAPLAEQPMATRAADPRVGYFTRSFIDFGNEKQEGRRTHYIKRWRLEKKDPAAAVSEPKDPIRVVMDRNIPEKWRAPIREGLLEWNKAFERAGFRNAVVVEQQPQDADWSTLEGTRMVAVRWFAQDGPGSTAVGPSQSDPRTGETLRGAVIIDENRIRVARARVAEVLPRFDTTTAGHTQEDNCEALDNAMDQAQFAYELLVARGQLDPNGPEAERFVAGALKDVSMHELGHVLGLRHNFKASTTVTQAQLRDPEFVARNGLSSSVMEYNGQNLPLEGETAAGYNMSSLGAYDYWAIEYGYRQFANADEEKRGLAALLARSDREPVLAYATDEDLSNNDPLVNQRDMSDDPLAFAQRQLKLSRELWTRTTKQPLAADDDLTLYRRALSRVFSSLATSLPLATKYIGGTYTTRTTAGSNKPLVVPVPAAQQRAALDLVMTELFNSASFRFDPQVMSRLGIDQFERFGPNRQQGVDFSLPTNVLTLQRGALDYLMSDNLAARLADAESKVANPRTLISYADVQERLSDAVWSETARGSAAAKTGDIDSLRRNLQREHLRRLAGGLLRPGSAAAADVRSVNRHVALQLQTRLSTALAGGKWSTLVRAHLEESLATLGEALKAPLTKQGV